MQNLWPMSFLMISGVIGIAASLRAAEAAGRGAPVILKSVPLGETRPPLASSCYTRPQGLEMIGEAGLSADGGAMWTPFQPTPDFRAGLPYGYRREPQPRVIDPVTGRIVTIIAAMDTPGLEPGTIEPLEALNTYYLRYTVSEDAGRTYLFDEPIVAEGRTPENPVEGVHVGKNAFMMGDIASEPIFLRSGELLVPSQVNLLGEDGKLANPGGSWSYFEVVVLRGTWRTDGRLDWQATRVKADPSVTTRGLIEPTLAEMPDGRILMVMRGSNDAKSELPGYKWSSVSDDGGVTWSEPKPWVYDNGEYFFSPSSMSQLIRHSSGRVFWIGNVTPENPEGNDPRWPLVMGEVDADSLRLIRSSLLTIDTRKPEDTELINISHWRAFEDRATGNIVALVPYYNQAYTKAEWTRYDIGIGG